MISVWPKFDVGLPELLRLELRAGRVLYPPFIPDVYPKGEGQWYDPFNPTARRVYWRQVSKKLFSRGLDGWWLDA